MSEDSVVKFGLILAIIGSYLLSILTLLGTAPVWLLKGCALAVLLSLVIGVILQILNA